MSESDGSLTSVLATTHGNPIKRWLLLTGPRFWVMITLMTVVFGVLLSLSVIRPIGMRELLSETSAATTLFSSLLSGAILLVSIVVSINSVVLSQEITDLENQQARIDASIAYHRKVEDFIEIDITPARPAHFLSAVLYAVSRQIESFNQLVMDSESGELHEDVDKLTESVSGEINRARAMLNDAQLGTFKVLLVGLNYDFSGQLHMVRGMKHKHKDTLNETQSQALDDIIDTLKYIGTGREYFKSLYYKRELARLSSRLLAVSLPVIVFTSYVILALDAAMFPEISLFGVSPLMLSVIFAYTVALAPYLILTAYIIRAATITLRTLAAGPFVLQKGEQVSSLEWDIPEQSRDWELSDRVDGD